MEIASETAPNARLRVVSGFELSIGGVTARLPTHVERLVAYLAVNERDQPRQRVAYQLWMDLPDARASANLRTTLWRARPTLDGHIVCRGGYLSLSPALDVDVRRLRSLARQLVHPEAQVNEADIDVALMAGDLLPDWDDEWLDAEREQLRQLRVHALEAWCRRLIAGGRFAEAVDVGLLALAVEPLRETAQRLVIEAHLGEGNPSEAHRRYRLYRTQLWEELGLEPSRGLRELVRPPHDSDAVRITVRRRSDLRHRRVIRSGS